MELVKGKIYIFKDNSEQEPIRRIGEYLETRRGFHLFRITKPFKIVFIKVEKLEIL